MPGNDFPPENPDDWSDEQWLEWLKATDDADDNPHLTPVRKATKSAPGRMLGQAMLGVAQAFYGPPDNDVTIVVAAPSEPSDDQPFTVHLDYEHPERSSVVIRPEAVPDEVSAPD